MKCEIVSDLLPLYAEHLTSEETAAALEAHLAECESCAAKLADMQESGTPQIAVPEDIKPLKAVRTRSRRNLLIAAAAVLLFACLFHRFFLRGTLLRSDQIEMKISTYWDLYNADEKNPGKQLKRYWSKAEADKAVRDGVPGTLYEQISITLDCDCLSVRQESSSVAIIAEPDSPPRYRPFVCDCAYYSVLLPPVGNPTLRHKSLWSTAEHSGTVAAGSSIMIRCSDGNFTYDIRTLAALADASPDGTAHFKVGSALESSSAASQPGS